MSEMSIGATVSGRSPLTVLVLSLLVIELLIIFLSVEFPVEVLLAIVGSYLLYVLARDIFAGLCALVVIHFFVIRGSEQISLPEIFFALCFCVVLGTWFFRKLFVERRPVLADSLDYALAGFLILCVLSFIPAFLFGSSIMKWLRELVPFLTLLLIFPIREQADSPKRIRILIACFLLLSLGVAVDNLFSYKEAVSRVIYAWELLSSRRHFNESLLMAVVIAAGGFLVMAKSAAARWSALLLLTLFAIALTLTFSRGYWVATLAGVFALVVFVPAKLKWRMLTSFGVYVLISVVIFFAAFGDLATFVLDTIGRRFHTVGQAVQDPSFANRLVEAQAVLAQIKENPIVGYGLGKTYFYDAIIPMEMPTWYVHNTMLFVWYKVGILGLICLLFYFGGIFIRGLQAYRMEKDDFLKPLLLILLACLVGMALVSFSSPQLLEKDSTLLAAMVCGLVQSVWRQQRRRETAGFTQIAT